MTPPASLDRDPAGDEAARQFLYARIDYERAKAVPYKVRNFKLGRVRELLQRIGNPQDTFPIIHVAGTKGKGSTAAMIAAVLSQSGYRTGIFTSPHLERLEERIAVDGKPCSPAELTELVELVVPAVESMDEACAAREPAEYGPTYFEVITAMAVLYFARRKVKAAILEVGLGGRLDSTNVCRPEVSAITSISLDHTQQLGNTLESIAREKAGIIKPGIPVVSGVLDPRPREVIRETCRQNGSRLVQMGVDFEFDYQPPQRLESTPSLGSLDFRYKGADGRRISHQVSLSLLGHHQAANAAVALAVLAELRGAQWEFPDQAVRAALANLTWPARVELVSRRPAVIIDSAHNPASIGALVRVLKESFSVKRRLLVFATTQEKDIPGMLSLLVGHFDSIIFTQYLENPRTVPPAELAAAAAELGYSEYQVCPTPSEAWAAAGKIATAEDLICVTGSFFTATEIRRQMATDSGSQSGGNAFTTGSERLTVIRESSS